MKAILLLTAFVFSSFTWAQAVDVRDVNPDHEGSTTIEIRKNKKEEEKKEGCVVEWTTRK